MFKTYSFCCHYDRYFLSYRNKQLNLYLPLYTRGLEIYASVREVLKVLQERETQPFSLSNTAVFWEAQTYNLHFLLPEGCTWGAGSLCLVLWICGFAVALVLLFWWVFLVVVLLVGGVFLLLC